jgi:hypothetical protein
MGGSTCTPTVAFPAGIEHGPMVAKPTPGSVVIAWRSVAPVSPAVEWGPTPAYGSLATGPSGTVHEIAIAGLTPGTPYHYRILLDGTPPAAAHLPHAPVDPAAPVRSPSPPTRLGVRRADARDLHIEAMNPDFVPSRATSPTWAARRRGPHPHDVALRRAARDAPVLVALGNHDVVTGFAPHPRRHDDADQRWTDRALLLLRLGRGPRGRPRHEPRRARRRAQIVAGADLAAASAARWKVLMFHHPVYSSSKHGSSPVLQATVAPLCDAHHVDLVFTGHDHDYERSHPMKAGLATDAGGGPAYVNPAGTIYVVSGGGGKDLYTRGTSSFTAYSESVHQAIRVDVLAAPSP